MSYFLRRKIHTSWQLAVASVGIVAGAVIAQEVPWLRFFGVTWLLTALAQILFSSIHGRLWMTGLALMGGLLLGSWRASSELIALEYYQPLYEKTVRLSGTIMEDADIDKRGNTTIRLTDVQIGGTKLSGNIWVGLGDKVPDVQRSDRVVLEGAIEEGFGTFAGTIYRPEIINIKRPVPGDVALSVRNWFADAVRRVVPEPQASLGIGYLVGQRRALPAELDQALQIAGLTHIVVASGYNLTILVRLARRLFEKISKYLSALSSAIMIAGFIAVTGVSPSMSRAGLVAGLSLAAWYYGRKIHPLVLLPLAMAVTILVNPSYAWGDVGWQLSFAAFTGVIVMAPLLQAYYFGDKKPGTVRQILGETFSAWVWTVPILAAAFGVISNVAIFANLLILPLVPLAMLLTFIAGIGALFLPAEVGIIGWPAQILLEYMTRTAEFFAGLDWAQQEVELSSWLVLVWYVVLVCWCVWMWRATRFKLAQVNIVE